jgi:hypothetical protein
MKIASFISFVCEPHTIEALFKQIGQESQINWSDTLQTVELLLETPDYTLFTDGLRSKGVQYDERFCKLYSDDELLAAEFLRMKSGYYWGYPQPENKYEQLCYDHSSACPKCGNGAKRMKPFVLKAAPKLRKVDMVTLNWVLQDIVSVRLVNVIKEEKLTGCAFWPLIMRRTKQPIQGWKELVYENELPPMSSRTVFPIVANEPIEDKLRAEMEQHGISNPPLCECGRLGRSVPDTICYDRKDIGQFADFNRTHEWLGGGYTTYQCHIVSSCVYRLFHKNSIRHASFEPVRIIG